MKKILVLLLCLSSVINQAYTSNIAIIDDEIKNAERLGVENEKIENKAKGSLLQTEDGKVYAEISLELSRCHQKNGFDSTICESLEEMREAALKKLEERPEYSTYFSAVTKRDYYAIKVSALCRAKEFALYQKDLFNDSEKRAMIAGINTMIKYSAELPSTSCLSWVNDIATTEQQVQKELRVFISKNIKTKRQLQAEQQAVDEAINQVERLMNN